MSTKIYKANVLDNCLRFGDLQILHLQGTVMSGNEKKISFPYIFKDDQYAVTVAGNYGSTVSIANKYKDCVYINVAGIGSYNTGKYEVIAIGKWK